MLPEQGLQNFLQLLCCGIVVFPAPLLIKSWRKLNRRVCVRPRRFSAAVSLAITTRALRAVGSFICMTSSMMASITLSISVEVTSLIIGITVISGISTVAVSISVLVATLR